jgi:hypothetical protein
MSMDRGGRERGKEESTATHPPTAPGVEAAVADLEAAYRDHKGQKEAQEKLNEALRAARAANSRPNPRGVARSAAERRAGGE